MKNKSDGFNCRFERLTNYHEMIYTHDIDKTVITLSMIERDRGVTHSELL